MRNFLEKNPILVFSEPFVKLLATVKHNVSSLVITESGYNYQVSLDRLVEILFLMILMHVWY